MTILEMSRQRLPTLLSQSEWNSLTQSLDQYHPEVIVLVARKMPRISEAIQLALPGDCVVISDLAIPFCSALLQGRRVAIVDDVVNVGTTIDSAAAQARLCGAAECASFALARREMVMGDFAGSADSESLFLVRPDPLGIDEYREFVRRVPRVVQSLPKPYDLDFPIVPTVLRPPFRSPDDVCSWLVASFGGDVHVLTSRADHGLGLVRASVDLHPESSTNMKARFYFDTSPEEGELATCNVVPMAVPSQFGRFAAYQQDTWSGEVWTVLNDLVSELPDSAASLGAEALSRAELFVHSLALGSEILTQVDELLALADEQPFSLKDAGIVFGPDFSRRLAAVTHRRRLRPAKVDPSLLADDSTRRTRTLAAGLGPEQWAALVAEATGLLQSTAMQTGIGVEDAFNQLFASLAEAIGADNPSKYSLSWPFSADEVRHKPYLRLRIGFTFHDLLDVFEANADAPWALATTPRNVVSALLDRGIDCGAVVPTVVRYGDSYCRAYRKGESGPVKEAIERVQYAWWGTGLLSRTRATKIAAILSYSDAVESSILPQVMPRGAGGFAPPSVVDLDAVEITHYLQVTGQLAKPVSDD